MIRLKLIHRSRNVDLGVQAYSSPIISSMAIHGAKCAALYSLAFQRRQRSKRYLELGVSQMPYKPFISIELALKRKDRRFYKKFRRGKRLLKLIMKHIHLLQSLLSQQPPMANDCFHLSAELSTPCEQLLQATSNCLKVRSSPLMKASL